MLECCGARLATMPCLLVHSPVPQRCFLRLIRGHCKRSEVFSFFSGLRPSGVPTGHVLIKPERKDVGALWRSGGLLEELTDVE